MSDAPSKTLATPDRHLLCRLAREIGGDELSNERAAEIELELLRMADICTYCDGSGSEGDEAAFPEPAREYPCERCMGTGRYLHGRCLHCSKTIQPPDRVLCTQCEKDRAYFAALPGSPYS